MITIIFVCHGNICRSVAAEYITKNLLKRLGIDRNFCVFSRATSSEELGNDIYPPMKHVLLDKDISIATHSATKISKSDYDRADYVFYMDQWNMHNMNLLFPDTEHKEHNICEYSGGKFLEIEDPWYTGRYERVYKELTYCIERMFDSNGMLPPPER